MSRRTYHHPKHVAGQETARGVSFDRARRVWAYLSQPGCAGATMTAIAQALNMPRSQVSQAVAWLVEVGYIGTERGRHGARRIVVPLSDRAAQ